MATKYINCIKRVVLIFVWLATAGATNVSAQQSDEEIRSDERSFSFWNWVLNVFNNDESWNNTPSSNDIYHEVTMKIDLSQEWKFSIGDNSGWSSATHDDHYWENIRVPSDWENDGFHGYDGYAWYRIHFDGRALNPRDAHFLILGFVDDVDETFLNGDLIGASGRFPPRFRTAYNSNRKYYISNDQINFESENTIAVRVYDEYANGGIVGGKPGIYISHGSEQDLEQNLYGTWKFSRSNSKSYSAHNYDDKDWENILVPSHWDNHGYRSYNGIAWYRKSFLLDFNFDNDKRYYLVLGKIDDFDVTYLNGEKIGETNDRRGLGESKSYDKIRIYEIPENLLNPVTENTIAVRVHDIGLEGGIYKGPIGIVEEADLTRILRKE